MNRKMRNGIRDFVAAVNPMIKVKFQKWDLECEVYEDTLYIGKCYDKRTDRYFENFIHTLNPDCNFNVFLLSLLHEIGHIETWDEDVADEKEIIYGLLKLTYDEEQNLTDKEMEAYCQSYYRIPLEQNATQWGIDFAMAHPQLMEKYSWLNNY